MMEWRVSKIPVKFSVSEHHVHPSRVKDPILLTQDYQSCLRTNLHLDLQSNVSEHHVHCRVKEHLLLDKIRHYWAWIPECLTIQNLHLCHCHPRLITLSSLHSCH